MALNQEEGNLKGGGGIQNVEGQRSEIVKNLTITRGGAFRRGYLERIER